MAIVPLTKFINLSKKRIPRPGEPQFIGPVRSAGAFRLPQPELFQATGVPSPKDVVGQANITPLTFVALPFQALNFGIKIAQVSLGDRKKRTKEQLFEAIEKEPSLAEFIPQGLRQIPGFDKVEEAANQLLAPRPLSEKAGFFEQVAEKGVPTIAKVLSLGAIDIEKPVESLGVVSELVFYVGLAPAARFAKFKVQQANYTSQQISNAQKTFQELSGVKVSTATRAGRAGVDPVLVSSYRKAVKKLTTDPAIPGGANPAKFNELNEAYAILQKVKPISAKFIDTVKSFESTLESQAGFVKIPGRPKRPVSPVSKIPKELEPLAQEARKFKTANEFIKSLDEGQAGLSVEHSPLKRLIESNTGNTTLTKFGFNPDETITIYRGIDISGGVKKEIVDGDYVATSRLLAESYTGDPINVVSKEVKIKDFYIDDTDFVKSDFKEINVDILEDLNMEGVFNSNKPLTDFQLTEIFNQVKGEVKPVPKVSKPLTQEVGVESQKLLTGAVAKEGEGFFMSPGKEQRVSPKARTIRETATFQRKLARDTINDTKAEIVKAKDFKLKTYKENLKLRQAEAIKILDTLPPEVQGKMKSAIQQTTTSRKAFRLLERVTNKLEAIEKRQGILEAQGIEKTALTARITPKYQRVIDAVVKDYNFKKPTKKTINRLTATREFLEKNPDYPIPDKYVEELRRLEKVNLSDLSTQDIKQFNETIQGLVNIGKEIQKHITIVSRLKFQNELNKATDKTVNLDFKNKTLNQALRAENATEFTFRVADKSDGSQIYKGWHAKFVKTLGQKVNKAEIQQANRMSGFFEEHAKINKFTLSEQSQKEVAAHLYANQGGELQMKKILAELGFKELPTLSAEQIKIRDLLVRTAKQKTQQIQPLWETTMVDAKGRPMAFDIQEKYFPFYYVEKGSDLGIHSILQDFKAQSSIMFGSGKSRVAGVKLTPRTDIYKMLQEAVAKQEIFLNLQPELFEKGTIFRTKQYQDVAGEVNTGYWTGYVDEMSRNGMSSNAIRTPMDTWFRKGRQNIARGLLDLSFTTTAIQPLAIFDAMAYMITYMPKATIFKLTGNFVQSFVRPNFAKKIISESEALTTRKGGEEVIQTFGDRRLRKGAKIPTTKREKITKEITKPFAALQFFDIRTAASVQKTVVNDLSKTLPLEQASAEADFIMDLVSGSSNLAYRPRIMNQGELGRVLTTFQTFVLNEWGLITQDILKKGIAKGGADRDIQTRLWAVIGLGFLFLQGFMEDKLRNKILNIVKGTEYEANSFLKSSLLYIPERVPILGSVVKGIEYGKTGLSVPIFSVFSNLIEATVGVSTAKELKTKLTNLSKVIEAVAILFFGIPGSKESQNIIERLIKDSDIGDATPESVAKDILEQIQSGELDIDTAKDKLEDELAKIETRAKKERLDLPIKEFATGLSERIRSEEITVSEGKKELEKFEKNKTKEEDSKDEESLNFFESLILGAKGILVDPANVARATFTKEKLSEVEGNLVALQRDFGEPFLNDNGTLNEKGSSELKKELAKKLGISASRLSDLRREHILPVKAGGGNDDKNLQLIPIELHEAYTPLDIAVGKAVRDGKITRKQASELMKSLKVKRDITIPEAFNQLDELSKNKKKTFLQSIFSQ